MYVCFNPTCAYGEGWRKWILVEPFLRKKLGKFRLESASSAGDLSKKIQDAVNAGEVFFIVGGGDGTVNLAANVLLNQKSKRSRFLLGAVGIGSSNDYHKPLDTGHMFNGIPFRIDSARPAWADVIRVDYRDEGRHWKTRYCLNNASIGITAAANALYNRRTAVVKWIKKLSVDGAIAAAAAFAVLTHSNLRVRLKAGTHPAFNCALTNLGIFRNPYFAGSLSYQPQGIHEEGQMGIFLCRDMTRLQAVSALIRLYRGNALSSPLMRTWYDSLLAVESGRLFFLEMDGEIAQADRVRFSLISRALRCCR